MFNSSKIELAVAQTEARFERALRTQFYWTITLIVALQVPTWIGLVQIWIFLATIAAKLPK